MSKLNTHDTLRSVINQHHIKSTTMSKTCSVCGRGTTAGNSRSHSNIASKRKFSINIQTKKVDGKKAKMCTKCIKTENKEA